MNISLMITCLGDCLRPAAGIATVNILRRLGHTISFPENQTCCGQPLFNSGFEAEARLQAQHTIETFAGNDPVVCPSGSCAAMVKVEYPKLFEPGSVWHERAVQLAARTHEFSAFLVHELKTTQLGAKFQGRVAYHFACHLRMLGQGREVETLVREVEGAEFVPIEREDQCCGFGGSFSVRYPEISGSLVDEKASCILAVNADVLVSTDAGCLMNIGGRLRRRGAGPEVLHIAELLDRRG